MANQSKLKAWVRYDGTGRVISGGPIFQVNKPKVGNWRQIDANLCCNGALTTTTTTTSGGGGGTPTAWFGQISTTGNSDVWKACNGFGNSIIVYTSTTSITAGTTLYSDAALTTPIPYSSGAISIYNGTEFLVYEIVNGQTNPLGGDGTPCAFVTTTTSTTVQQVNNSVFRQSETDNNVCISSSLVQLFWIGQLTNGTQVFTDQALTQGYNVMGYISDTSTGLIFQTSNGSAFSYGTCNG